MWSRRERESFRIDVSTAHEFASLMLGCRCADVVSLPFQTEQHANTQLKQKSMLTPDLEELQFVTLDEAFSSSRPPVESVIRNRALSLDGAATSRMTHNTP